ncbi:GDSL-like Lipase/Acylhydrolase superfamily protein [Theobroma cacao]|uniref:GDSL-like Lipase/Acylhydrolase superfamily protein n=1 Tax=Theobroma cacao TaxID=3641 RepID=A0A061GDN9_THECC|nr:GDSL-like Lipase/Acylhydrolase superfamily protein [Theobroma cacao]
MLNRLIIVSAMYQILAIHFSPSICSAKKVSAMFVFGDSLVEGAHICMDAQINNFAKTRQDIISRIGAAAARKLLRQALYIIIKGANVVFDKAASSSHDDDSIYFDDMISKFRSQLTSLYNLDAREIAVTNSRPVGCTPNQRDRFSTDDCVVARVNQLSKLYNTRLKNLLTTLTTSLAGSTFVYQDTYAALEDILQNYKSYGIENADSACCRVLGKPGG